MYELIEIAKQSYYIACPTNMGVFLRENGKVVIFDTGNSSKVGKEIRKILDNKGWQPECIINTHSHADHISGNSYLQNRYEIPIFANTTEGALAENTRLLPSIIYGGNPPKKLLDQALLARPSVITPLSHSSFPKELMAVDLKGHSPDQIGIVMPNHTVYLGDALVGELVLEKYYLPFLYNLADYYETLNRLENIEASWYLFAHIAPTQDISRLILVNRKKLSEIEAQIWERCKAPATFEDIMAFLVKIYNIQLSMKQYYLTSHTIRGFLSYLLDNSKLETFYEVGREYWKQV